jgi:hypothetical protein
VLAAFQRGRALRREFGRAGDEAATRRRKKR